MSYIPRSERPDFKKLFFFLLCVHVWTYMYYGARVEVRGQLSGAGSLLPLWGLGIELSLPSTHSKHFYPPHHLTSPDWTL